MYMNQMMFIGRIMGVDQKTDDTTQDVDTVIELIDVHGNGEVEIALNDRNERFFVRFNLHDLVQRAMAMGRKTDTE